LPGLNPYDDDEPAYGEASFHYDSYFLRDFVNTQLGFSYRENAFDRERHGVFAKISPKRLFFDRISMEYSLFFYFYF
jgi:hypothetical protein